MSGSSLAGVTQFDLTVWTNFPVCRPSSGISETSISETENKNQEDVPHEGYVESTTLQIRPATTSQSREFYVVPVKSGAPLAEEQASGADFPGSRKEETGLAPHTSDSESGRFPEEIIFREKADAGRPGTVVELQLSLSQERRTGARAAVVALLGAEKSKSPDPEPDLQHDGLVHINSAPTSEKEDAPLRSSKIIQISSGQELSLTQGSEAAAPGLPRLEVVLDCSDRQKTEGCRLQAAEGCVAPPVEGGPSEAPPSLVSFAVSSEGTGQGEDPRAERDHSRPHKHRARHARKSCAGSHCWAAGRGLGVRAFCCWFACLDFLFLRFFLCLSLAFFFFFKLMHKITNMKL